MAYAQLDGFDGFGFFKRAKSKKIRRRAQLLYLDTIGMGMDHQWAKKVALIFIKAYEKKR